ncbi:hypothetical protein [Merismopedia glauca]|uniref:Uncharacterized protein n=1 Tax=Merismopedia glauca CCAP 1448/3 TaxID=1296344 RepID=A0A2T1C3H4_9CYAN|nr:hypothetical protein [Merismopedia glauca]PSB02697.1 hypothetical protein C7B64_12030 [Merismopedia glauca CCAP 1448/3]
MTKISKIADDDGEKIELDPTFEAQLEKLHRLSVYGRWLTVLLLWLSVGAGSLWQLRYNIGLLQENFTWAAVRYGLLFNPLPTIGLSVCIGMTAAVLVWQSRNILYGLSEPEQKRLVQQVRQIRHQGRSHPLWRWICQD